MTLWNPSPHNQSTALLALSGLGDGGISHSGFPGSPSLRDMKESDLFLNRLQWPVNYTGGGWVKSSKMGLQSTSSESLTPSCKLFLLKKGLGHCSPQLTCSREPLSPGTAGVPTVPGAAWKSPSLQLRRSVLSTFCRRGWGPHRCFPPGWSLTLHSAFMAGAGRR